MCILAGYVEAFCLLPTILPYGKTTKECSNCGCFHKDHVRLFFFTAVILAEFLLLFAVFGGGTATGQKLICCLS